MTAIMKMVNEMGVDLFVNPKSLRAAILLKMKKEQIEKYSDDVIGVIASRPTVIASSWEELYSSANLFAKIKPDFIAFATIGLPSAEAAKVIKEHAEKMLRAAGLSPKSFSFRIS